ncbi:MAG TPA: LysR family transcriptional regulator [Bdellovibrionota bacterium]|nr:LysR family transcriptional regulator [Bdellovibrionota bacterium]
MIPIDFDLFRVLIAFAESKNMVEASQRLRISQPAVSQRLQRLQSQMAAPLFAVDGRRKVLTHYGQSLYEFAKDQFARMGHGLEQLNRRYSDGKALVLRVGSQKELFEIFAREVQFSGRLEFRQVTAARSLRELREDHLDVTVTDSPPESHELVSKRLFEGPWRFVFKADLFPRARDFLSLQSELRRRKEIPCVQHRTERLAMDRFLAHQRGGAARFVCKASVEDWASVVALVREGVGCAVVPPFVQAVGAGLRGLDVPHAVVPRSDYFVVYHPKLTRIAAFQKALSFSIRDA